MEEAAVRIDPSSIQYKGSQPWFFPRSLMFGFHAEVLRTNDNKMASDCNESHRLSDPFEGFLPSCQSPISTRGGTSEHLPAIHPDEDEMEDVRWVHSEFLQ